jgi:hypothetical protein
MKSMLWAVILATSPLMLSACGPDRAWSTRLAIPLRPCVIRGADWTIVSDKPITGGGNTFIDGQINSLINDASQIWQTGADIAFYPGPINFNGGHVPVIDDPFPPGSPNDASDGKSHLGDIYPGDFDGSPEIDAAVASCNAAWGQQFAAPQPGIPVIIARNFVGQSGQFDQRGAVSPDINAVYSRNGGDDICKLPRHISAADVNNRWIILSLKASSSTTPLKLYLAHELGHAFLLNHGDGLDNDNNGKWDLGCDPAEYGKFDANVAWGQGSIMNATVNSATTITPLQRDLARHSAALITGACCGSP